MIEQFLDEVTKIIYWRDREPQATEYLEQGITRIDLVHMPTMPELLFTERDRLVSSRINRLQKAGLRVVQVGISDQSEGIRGKSIVVGGAYEDLCVLSRAKFLHEQGAGIVIIDLALTESR